MIRVVQVLMLAAALGVAAAQDFAPAPEPAAPLPLPPVAPPPAVPAAAPVAPHLSAHATVAVLGYGKICAESGKEKTLSLAEFARQMDYLERRGLCVLTPEQFLNWRSGNEALPAASCVLITLDETDAETCRLAVPVLQQHGFTCVAFADAESLRGENLKQLLSLKKAGAVIGSHTFTRPERRDWQFAALRGAGELRQLCDRELGASAERLRGYFGECRFFSYPAGYTDAAMVNNLPHYGYEAAFCNQVGKVRLHAPLFRLHRYMVANDTDFSAAVNFGVPSETTSVLAAVQSTPLAAYRPEPVAGEEGASADTPAAVPAPDFDDDEVAETVDEEASARGLTRRTPTGDWVTASFAAPTVPREQTRVAVLGYHNFSNVKPVSEMRMRTADFCRQMQYIRDAGLSVITMEDFLEWLRGERCLPERCVLITLDDGWKSVYTDAFPVLRAYGYPFTMFLYTAYVQVKGDSLTKAQIAEMVAAGATVGSHSSNHLYPRMWKRYAQNSEKYAAQVQAEIPDSCTKLKSWFTNCSTYCYPGGYNTPPMLEALEQPDYRAAFTVLEKKVTIDENPYLVHRYMVFGNDHRIFRRAVNFDGTAGVKPTEAGIAAADARARAFFPPAFAGLKEETSNAPNGTSPVPCDSEGNSSEPGAGSSSAE